MEKVSVIIPIYNEEKNIEKCVSCYIKQLYEENEILLIDNGSNDSSWNLIQKLQKEHSNVKGFRISEKGVSRARNYGIEKAQGKYLFFADADDYAEDSMLHEMIKRLERDASQLVIAGYYFDIPVSERKANCFESILQRGMELYLDDFKKIKEHMTDLWDNGLMYNVWNKLFLKDVVVDNNLWFPVEQDFNEDRVFVRNYVLHIDKISCIETGFYHYIRENQGSATGVYRKDMLEIRKKEFGDLRIFFQKIKVYGDKEVEYIAREHLERVIGYSESLLHTMNFSKKEIKKELGRICEDDDTRYVLQKANPTSKKMKIMVIPYKLKSISAIYWMLRIIAGIRNHYPVLFNKLRQER